MKHLMTVIALSADKVSLSNTTRLLTKLSGTKKLFVYEIAIMLENNLIPQVDQLKEQSIADIVALMSEIEISKSVYMDLLATEFARKHKTDEYVSTHTRCFVLH